MSPGKSASDAAAEPPPRHSLFWMVSAVVAALLGLQSLAASVPVRSYVLMLLTPEGLLAGV